MRRIPGRRTRINIKKTPKKGVGGECRVMGKRYKSGNHGKRKAKHGQAYIKREIRINQLIRQFKRIMNTNPYKIGNYKKADRIRLQIKHLLDIQGAELHTKSRRRRYVYYKQVSDFKGLYVTWKKLTFPQYLMVRCNCPQHLIPILSDYYKNLKKGENPELIRYW